MAIYLSRRHNAVGADEEELDAKLGALARVFDETWLDADGAHPLQLLWRRPDALATNELLNFGDAVERRNRESPEWLRDQARIVKEGDGGQRAGAIFEILALNMFSRKFCRVAPAPGSMPGFDGTLLLNDGSRVLVSVKNHGRSSREQAFLDESKAFDEEFQEQLAAHGLRDAEVNVLAPLYMEASSFRSLKVDIAACLADMKAGKAGGALDRPYTISIRGMAGQYDPLSTFGNSSICRVMSPIAPNEQINFHEAIRKGCRNLYNQTRNETGDVCRMIVLRLSNTASVAKCREWATWYFAEYPDDPVDVVLLYQASVTTDAAADTSSISHYVSVIPGPRFFAWQRGNGGDRRLPNISFFVGVVADRQPSMLLTGDGMNGVDLGDFYVYQRADVYQRAKFEEGAETVLSNSASGMMVHAIFERDGAPVFTVSSRAEREKALILLP